MSTTKELIDALGTIEYWGEPSIDDFETVELQRAQFARVVKMLEKAISQRNQLVGKHYEDSANDLVLLDKMADDFDLELLKIARGES